MKTKIDSRKPKNRREREISNSSKWDNSFFFSIAIAIQVCLSFLALLHAWTIQYKSQLSPDGFVNRISYISADKPWMPNETNTTALLHLHYFGDWVLNVAYGGIARPYDPSLEIPAQFAPVGILFFCVMYLIGYKLSYVLLLLATAYLWWNIVTKLFSKEDILKRLVILFFIVFVTAPGIIAFDRGGTQLFVIGLAGNSYLNYKTNREKLAFAQYLLAVSMKPYIIFFTLILLLDQQIQLKLRIIKIIKILVGIFSINFSLLFIVADNPIKGLRDQFAAIARFAGDWGIPWIMDGASLTSFVSKTYEFLNGNQAAQIFMKDFIPFWPRVLALIYLGMLLISIVGKQLSYSLKIFLILSTTSLVSPFSGPYTIVWLSLAILFIIHEFTYSISFDDLTIIEKIILCNCISACYIGLTPYFGYFHMPSGAERHVPGNYFYIFPILVVLFISAFREMATKFITLKKT